MTQSSGTEGCEKGLNSAYIWEVQPTGFSDDLEMLVKQKEGPRLLA